MKQRKLNRIKSNGSEWGLYVAVRKLSEDSRYKDVVRGVSWESFTTLQNYFIDDLKSVMIPYYQANFAKAYIDRVINRVGRRQPPATTAMSSSPPLITSEASYDFKKLTAQKISGNSQRIIFQLDADEKIKEICELIVEKHSLNTTTWLKIKIDPMDNKKLIVDQQGPSISAASPPVNLYICRSFENNENLFTRICGTSHC